MENLMDESLKHLEVKTGGIIKHGHKRLNARKMNARNRQVWWQQVSQTYLLIFPSLVLIVAAIACFPASCSPHLPIPGMILV